MHSLGSRYIRSFATMALLIFWGSSSEAQDSCADPGNIITDAEFLDTNGLSQSGVQAFLNTRAGRLDEQNLSSSFVFAYSGGSLYNHVLGDGALARTAAPSELIYWAARDPSPPANVVNPKVLLALLQKEQSLIDDGSPIQSQMDAAVGYACTSGGCDPAYRGFSSQLLGAAYQLTQLFEGSFAGEVIPVEGGGSVVASNKASAALYKYNPSTHGNCNFRSIYESFFGSTAPPGSCDISNPACLGPLLLLGDDTCIDTDRDGFGNPASEDCGHPGRDCDDSNPAVNPGRTEVPGNGIDDDCNAATSDCLDTDGDGYGNPGSASCSAGSATDCNNSNPAVNPGRTEVPGNGVDDDCNAATSDCLDTDGDGYGNPGSASCSAGSATDCNNSNPAVNPGRTEVPGNGIDDDCNPGTPDTSCTDLDLDGYGSPASAACAHPQLDCNDSNASVNPGAVEVPGNGIDDDCNPATPTPGCGSQPQLANAATTGGSMPGGGLPMDLSAYFVAGWAVTRGVRRRSRPLR